MARRAASATSERLVRLASPHFADAADVLLELRIAEILHHARAGDFDCKRRPGVDERLTGAGDVDLRPVAFQIARPVRPRAGQSHDLRADFAGDLRLGRAGPFQTQPGRLQVPYPYCRRA